MEISNEIFFAQIEEMLSEGKHVQLRIKGYSMRPWIRNNRNVVVLKPFSEGDALHEGDLCLFRYRDKHIFHRLHRIEGDHLTFQGDGLYHQWEHATRKDVLAIAESIIRPNGSILRCDSTRWKWMSQMWLCLPALMRRYILAVLFRLGWK